MVATGRTFERKITMREIKFRAWDDRENQMSSRIELDFYGRIEVNAAFATMLREGHVTLMQFTGLRDRNGREIYEEDILLEHGSRKYVVRWYGQQATIRLGLIHKDAVFGGSLSFASCDPINIEVIGNIYENPELLK